MPNDTSIQAKIEAALNSLDNLQRAEPKPFFYTRLSARLNNVKQNQWEKFSSFITQPVHAFAGVALFLMINILAAYTNIKNTATTSDQTEGTATITDEYSQVATNFYDFENLKP